MIKFLFLLPVKILGLLFMAIGSAINAAEQREAEREKQAERIRREYEKQQREKQKAAERATDRARRIAMQEQREADRREKERINAERDKAKFQWAEQREAERQRAAAWRECCYKSKLGLEYQNAIDNETYTRVRGSELYAMLEQYEQELIDAVDAGNAKQIEQARKKLINTRRLLRENEKAVYMDQFKKQQYKAYSGE